MTFSPGFGSHDLHLGQTSSSLRDRFGQPTSIRQTGTFRDYWLYPVLGLEAIISRRTGNVLSLFFSRAETSDQPGVPSLLGTTEKSVVDQFGSPDLRGGDFQLPGGNYVDRWFSYDRGIGFHFDRQGYVKTVSIFAPKRKIKIRKPAAQHGRGQSRSIAALRQSRLQDTHP